MRIKFLIPFFIFLGLAGFLVKGLYLDPRQVPNNLVEKPFPTWSLPELSAGHTEHDFSTAEMAGKVWLVNVWATWCGPCQSEHPELMRLKETYPNVPIVGFVYRDRPEAAQAWLQKEGNPYQVVVYEPQGARASIDMGVTGVPETFLIDKHGVVRKHFSGTMTEAFFKAEFLPLIQQLEAQP